MAPEIPVITACWDSDYSGARAGDVTVRVDDEAGVKVSATRVNIAEGGTGTYEVKLTSEPSSAVTVTVRDPTDNTSVTADPASLTFTASNWSTAQRVTVSSEDDDIVTGVRYSATVTHTVTSTDNDYNEATVANLEVRVRDDDEAGVKVSATRVNIAEGGTGTYEIKLTSEPSSAVTVTVRDPTDNTSVTADPASLTFTASNWSTAQRVTVSSEDDDIVTGVRYSATVTHTVTSTDNDYNEATVANLEVRVRDDDEAGVKVSATRVNIAEGGTGTYEVKLTSEPSSAVTVTVKDPTDNTSVTADPASLTFTASNWSTAQRVTVSSEDDDIVTGVRYSATVTHTVTSTDSDYSGATAAEVEVRVRDDDTAGVTVSDSPLNIAEGGTGTYRVVLTSEPSSAVTVTVKDPTDNTDVTADPASLTFTASNWSTAQRVTVSSEDDDIATSGLYTATVTHTVTSTDSDYSGATAAEVEVRVHDNDEAGVTVSDSPLNIAEGGTGTYRVVLTSQPSSAVTVTVKDPTDNTSVTAVQASLTFTASNWDMAQRVTVSSEDDDIATSGLYTATVTHTVTSTDSDYSGATAAEVEVRVHDNDEAGVTVSDSPLNIAEGGTGTYRVVLTSQPSSAVTVTVNDPTDNTDVTTDPASLTFTASNWSTAQRVTVSSEDDDIATSGLYTATVTHTVTSTDSDYSGATAGEVDVNVSDDDTAGVTVSDSPLNIAEGGTGTYRVVLTSEPSSAVTVTVKDPTDNTDVTTDPASLTFIASNWNTAQTVTVSAADDNDAAADTATVTHTVTSTDNDYNEATAAKVDVNVSDDDTTVPTGSEYVVVTLVQIPDETVIPDDSNLTIDGVGKTVVDGLTWVEGEHVVSRLLFEGNRGGRPPGDGVNVDLEYEWRIDSPIAGNLAGELIVISKSISLHWAEVWDTAVQSFDDDVGSPDATLTIRIVGCERNGCVIGSPYELTVTVRDNDGGPAASPPGRPDAPRLVCAATADGYDPTGIAASWGLPAFVGGAEIEGYELRYRQRTSTNYSEPWGWGAWHLWPHRVTATSENITGLEADRLYGVQVRAVNANGSGPWSLPWNFLTGQSDNTCEILDQYTPHPQ